MYLPTCFNNRDNLCCAVCITYFIVKHSSSFVDQISNRSLFDKQQKFICMNFCLTTIISYRRKFPCLLYLLVTMKSINMILVGHIVLMLLFISRLFASYCIVNSLAVSFSALIYLQFSFT